MVNIMKGTNSYYKLQVLESDKKNRFVIYELMYIPHEYSSLCRTSPPFLHKYKNGYWIAEGGLHKKNIPGLRC